jgi:ACS family hexuronate transporter-like MFS transporter
MDSVRPNSTSDLSASPTETTATALSEPALPKAPAGPGYFRWVICGLLLLGTTKNYMDRWVLSALKTTLQHDLGWSEIDYSHIVIAFQAAYAVGMLAVGVLIYRVGTR